MHEQLAKEFSLSVPELKKRLASFEQQIRAKDRNYVELSSESCAIEAAEASTKKGQFDSVVYTGGVMSQWWGRVVVDLAGIETPAKMPILLEHEMSMKAGHANKIEVSAQRIYVSGKLSATEAGNEIMMLAADGFPWQMSMGADIIQSEEVPAGESVKVNGKNFDGPLIVARKSRLKESSFVGLGADSNTTATVAASRVVEGKTMDPKFAAWLAEQQIQASDLTPEGLKRQEERYAESIKAAAQPKIETKLEERMKPADAILASANEQLALQVERAARIQAIGAEFGVEGKIVAQAIRDNVDPNQFELTQLRASKKTAGPAIHMGQSGSDPGSAEVIEAALFRRMHPQTELLEKNYSAKTLEAMDKTFKRSSCSLRGAVLRAAAANGYAVGFDDQLNEAVFRAACADPLTIKASYTTHNLKEIFENLANKVLLIGYGVEDDTTWELLSTVKGPSDTKVSKMYRMIDGFEYEELQPDGTIKHGEFGSESFSYSAKMYAKMAAITAMDMRNDDLGAFDTIRDGLGRGAIKAFRKKFWSSFAGLSAGTTAGNFWSTVAPRKNYKAGATTAFDLAGVGLQAAIDLMGDLTAPPPNNDRLGMTPRVALLPYGLMINGEKLLKGQFTPNTVSDVNPYSAMGITPIYSRLLQDYGGNKAWYLLGGDTKPMIVSFLDGVRVPVIESSEMQFNMLGTQFRGYHGFGVDAGDPLCGVKMKGEA